MQKAEIKKFQELIWDFYKKNKRDLPWRNTTNPYYILVSEIMLQQTQADRVIPYYKKFIKRFPAFKSLAGAKFSEIYPLWQGLGYNRRALALKKLAEIVTKEYQGKLPVNPILLQTLPGIGPYTARAIIAFAHNRPVAFIETNIRRVFIHYFFEDQEQISDQDILKVAEEALDQERPREWHWALMDYGAYLKKITVNPNRRHKNYTIQSKFEGSLRQIRGAILRNLMEKKMTAVQLVKVIKKDPEKTAAIISTLEKEGLIKQNKKLYSLN